MLSTKVGRYGDAEFDFSAERVTRSVQARADSCCAALRALARRVAHAPAAQESLERLCVDYIDVIQCHDIEFGDLQQVVDETLPGACRVRAAGVAAAWR